MPRFLYLLCRYFVSVALWLLSSLAYSAPLVPVLTAIEATATYSLTQAFLDAQANDARIRAAQSRVVQAQYRLAEVNSSRLPVLSTFGDVGYGSNKNRARTNAEYKGKSVRYGLRASQNIHTFGRTSSRLRAAEAEIAATEQAAEVVRQDVLAEVGQSFSEQLLRERMLELWRTLESLAVDLEQVARQRLALKALDQTELYSILRRLHQARAERISAQARHLIARARLSRLTGGASAKKTLLPTSLDILNRATPATLSGALMQAERGSPTLKRARKRLEVAQGELGFHKAELRPNLSMNINASNGEVGGNDVASVDAVFKLFVPLYAGGSKRAQRDHAIEAVTMAQWELEAEQSRIRAEVRTHWHLLNGLTMARQEFEIAFAAAQKSGQQIQIKFDMGQTTLVQTIESRQSALDAEFNLLTSNLQMKETRITLLRVLGVLNLDGN